jgi:hypothetical protein
MGRKGSGQPGLIDELGVLQWLRDFSASHLQVHDSELMTAFGADRQTVQDLLRALQDRDEVKFTNLVLRHGEMTMAKIELTKQGRIRLEAEERPRDAGWLTRIVDLIGRTG